MFDEDKKCDEGDNLHGSCWSKECCQLDERNCTVEADKVAHTVVAGGGDIHKLNMCNCENIYECGDSFRSGQLYLFREIHDSCQSLNDEEICRNDNFGSKESHENVQCCDCKENSENSQPAVHNTEELDNCKTDHCLSESDRNIEYNHLECNVFSADSQAGDDHQSYRSTYPTDLSDDDSLPYDNSDAETNDDHEDEEEDDDGEEEDVDDNDDDDDEDDGEPDDDTRSLYIIECNSEEFLETRPATGFATIIRAFSVWAEMEQFEKPPPPAAKEVVQNLEEKIITEEGYQCPVCLGMCEIGETLKLLPCAHAFHNECILPWLDKTNTCPLCRHEMPTDNEDYEFFKKIETGRHLRN